MNPRTLLVGMLAFASLPLLAGSALAALPAYTVKSISISADAINNLGDVAGWKNIGGVEHAMILKADGTVIDLGAYNGENTRATGINDSGQAVVMSSWTGSPDYTAADAAHYHIFRTEPYAAINPATDNMGTLGGQTQAWAINNSGQIAGFSRDPAVYQPIRTSTPTQGVNLAMSLGTFTGGDLTGALAYAINNLGQVAGNSGNSWHAFRTAPTGLVSDPGTDLGTLGGFYAEPHAINDSGQVAGFSYETGDTTFHAFRTSATGTLTDPGADLGTLGGATSRANDINVFGDVVGRADIASGAAHAFVYSGSQMYDLDPTGIHGWYSADAINDAGQILVNGSFILTPVPEPASLSLFALAVTVLLTRRRPPNP